MNDRFISYEVDSDWYCGEGGHPDTDQSGVVYDARTGKSLTMGDIWRSDKKMPPAENPDASGIPSKAWYDYQDKIFAPAVVRLFSKLYPEQMRKPADDDSCDYSSKDVWSSVEFNLNRKGLQLFPDFPHVVAACGGPDWAVVPYSVLRKNNPALFSR